MKHYSPKTAATHAPAGYARAGEAAFDSQEEARKEAARLGAADCVLCSYEVLHKEVHFAPNEARLSSLRHQKKYEIAESPLLRLR